MSLHRDERATVGIGTMIVFIATVLVAAIAAGVIIQTSGELQQKSHETGKEATEQVASNLHVVQIIGIRDASTDPALADLDLYVTLSPGAIDVDLSQARIFLNDGAVQHILAYSDTAPSATEFTAVAQRDADSSFTPGAPAMNAGDLVRIRIELDTVGLSIEPRDNLELRIVPEVGESVAKSLRASSSYGTATIIPLG